MDENRPELPSSEGETVRAVRPAEPATAGPGDAGGPPKRLGRYAIERKLGAGGYGEVFLALDEHLRRRVAIKVLRAGRRDPATAGEEFHAEARRLAQLRHPGIVAVHDGGAQDGLIYIVSDFLEGPNLQHWLRSERPDWRESVRIVAEVADALAYAHARSIIHRDIKPENIILVDGRTPVLIDFGLGLDESRSGSDEIGAISGTYPYMAPEQAAGQAHRIDGRTDIYGLGVVLYQMLCGRVPFRSFDRKEVLRQVQEDEPQPPRQLAPDVPPPLERICLKTLAKRMQDRYVTAADLAGELRALLKDATLRPPPADVRDARDQASIDTVRIAPGGREASSSSSGGSDSSAAPRSGAAERRQVTMLACGCALFDSPLFFELDDEDEARVRARFERVSEDVVQSLGGTVTQRTHNGFLACFGYPIAHEDAGRRAAAAGLKLLDELRSQRHPELGDALSLTPWIGLHTAGAIAEVRSSGVAVAGDAPNVAARFETIAEPGAVTCSTATYQLIRDYFECESLGPHEIRGVLPPSDTYLVREPFRGPTRLERTGADRLTPLIGRDHEVSLIIDRWQRATEGLGQVVQIIGEAGLGKSRLVYTLKQHLRSRAGGQIRSADGIAVHPASSSEETGPDWAIVEWRCSPQRQSSSFYPVVDFFERLLDLRGAESPEAAFDRLAGHLDTLGLATGTAVPLFASLLSLPLDERFRPCELSPPRQRDATLTAIRDWLRASASLRTVLFIVEDLQWIDASTLELLESLVAERQPQRILTVLTFRPDFKTPWAAAANQTTLALTRLSRKEVTAMLQRQIKTALPSVLVDQLVDRTGGVPLFVEEFARLVGDSGALDRVGTDTGRIRALFVREIPATLQDLVTARLDRVGDAARLAQLAATIGREFTHELLAAVAGKDETTLQAELSQLLDAEILYQKGHPPRCTYIFKHALLEDAAYNSLVKTTRQQNHRRIAEVLESQFPQLIETQPELLAHHFAEAGLTLRSVEFWLKAGLRARRRSADMETIASLSRGLALLETLSPSSDRDSLELQFLNPLVTAYIAIRGYSADDIGPVLDRARVLCERVGDRTQLFVLVWGTWIWHIVRGEFRLSESLAADTMRVAETLDDPSAVTEALFPVGATMLYRGDFEGARTCFERAMAEADPNRAHTWSALTGHDIRITSRCNLALALWYLGWPEQALTRIHEALDVAEGLGQPFHVGYVLHHSGWLHHHSRLAAEAEAAGDREIEIAVAQGSQSWHATGRMYKAAGMLLRGRIEGVPLFLDGLAAYRATGHQLALPYYLGILAYAHTRMGRFKDALDTLQQALETVEANDDRFEEAELHRLKGEAILAQSSDQRDAAESCFQQALTIARRQKSRAWELRTATSLARLWQNTGRAGEAKALLGEVRSSFTEGHSLPDFVDASALLAELA